MEIRDFTPNDYDALVDVHRSLNIVWPEGPRTAGAYAEAERARAEKYRHRRWVAVEGGRVVGAASYDQPAGDYHPHRFYVNVEVLPAYQRQGIGSRLYDTVMEGLVPYDPWVLRADAFANLPRGFTFLQKRGFYEAFRETPVHLDIAAFDPSPYSALEPGLNTCGIIITTLSELEGDPRRSQKLFDLFCEVCEDLPREESEVEKPSYEDWLRWQMDPAADLADAYFVATDGDRYIGLRELYKYADGTDTLLGSLLGVRRPYRGRGIALAMQLRGIAYARDHGYAWLKTCTAVQNKPMQNLFNKLGFARDPEWQQCQKDIKK